jgi:6,7-dimethyl-8-ribityllumazine synthase
VTSAAKAACQWQEIAALKRCATQNPRRRYGVTEKNHKLKLESLPDPAIPALEGRLDASGKRFAIVVSRFNAFITERLLLSACDGLIRTGAAKKDIAVVRVPGAFEVPSAARTLAETKKYDAIICIGCLLRGDTAHYDVIVNEVTRGIGQSAQETGVPHAFGVLTCDTLEQAIDRAGLKMGNKGFEAALAAVEMASLKQVIGHRSSLVGKKQVPHPRSARVRNDIKKNKASIRKKR